MRRDRPISVEEEADHDRGPYDPDPVAEQDLWFLPGDGVEEDRLPPGPGAERVRLFDPDVWQAAQDQLSRPLAELAALFGALDERLRGAPEGWHQRLALLEVADLGWWTGDRIASDRLALWVGLRLGATGEDAQALTRAGWGVRRLSAGPGPSDGGWDAGLAAFLGRATAEGERPESLADLADLMADAAALHPITQSAMLFHGWRMLGPERAGQGATIDIEAAVLAACHAAGAGRGGALFLPLALTGPTALHATGTEAERLGAWIAGAAQATQAALLQLDRLRDWEARARAATSDLSGRTPPALITALVA